LVWRYRSDVSKHWNTRYAGSVAGSVDTRGRIQVKIDGEIYSAHRVIFLYVTGVWPSHEIDHADMNKQNNKWVNIREAIRSENCANRKVRKDNLLSVKGVKRTRNGKFQARIQVNKCPIYLGTFNTIEEANLAYMDAAVKYFGEFARAS
jgi:hypothetical protein